MPSRRPRGHTFALVAAVLLLCVPVLSSCGFNKILDRPYTQANGINYRKGDVFVLNAVIAAAQANSGTLIASFTNQSDSASQTLVSVSGGGGNLVTSGDFSPISIVPMGSINLAETGGITLSGDFDAGDVIPLTMGFEDGSSITMDVPVVYACQQYTGLDVSQSSAAASTTDSASVTSTESAATPSTGGTKVAPTAITPIAPTDADSATAAATPSGEATPTPSDTTAASSGASPTAYTCGTSGGTGGRN